ncbi:hypothetical protein AWC11_11290 [Mycobacterium interjectum]|nr:hypothetical protein AWC11_11290 [Mycobacterium interjectum]
MGFEFNFDGMKQAVRDLQNRAEAGVSVPLGGSEDDAIRSVQDQLVEMGLTPDDAEVERYVRDARNIAQQSKGT